MSGRESPLKGNDWRLHMAMLALENIGESIYWLDIDGCILYVNPSAERELGRSADELQRMRISDIDPNVPPEAWGEDGEIAKMLATGGLHNFVTQHRHRDGHLFPVEINSGAFNYDGKLYSMAICRDISQRLAADEALRASEAKFAAMFSLTPDPMSLTRLADGTLLDVSVSYADFFGFKREEMIGQTTLPDGLGLWLDPAHRLAWRDDLDRVGEVLGFETPLKRKDGTVVTVLISGRIIDLAGEQCVIVVLRDITRRKQMEELLRKEKAEQAVLIRKLEETQRQLLQSEKLAAIGQLSAGVAHEINNPMGFIRSNLATLGKYVDGLLNVVAVCEEVLAGPLDGVAARDRLAEVQRQVDLPYLREDARNLVAESIDGAERVRRIVQDLKDFSRIGDVEWETCDLAACLESSINLVWNEIKYKAELVREFGVLPPVECIPSRLTQVFTNLLVNAVQAIPERGTITIATRHLGDEVEVAVTDTGEGIPADLLPKIFDPFFTTKPIGKGTGLGLSVSYGIVKNHGGEIDVTSQPGKGTTMTIRLPISRRADIGEAVAESPSNAA